MSATTNVLNDAFNQYYEESCNSIRNTITHYNSITKRLPEPFFTKHASKMSKYTSASQDAFKEADRTYRKILETLQKIISDYNKLDSNTEEKKIIDVCNFQNKIKKHTDKIEELIDTYLSQEARAKKYSAKKHPSRSSSSYSHSYSKSISFSWTAFLSIFLGLGVLITLIILSANGISVNSDSSLEGFIIVVGIIGAVIGLFGGIGGLIIGGIVGAIVGGLLNYLCGFLINYIAGNIILAIVAALIGFFIGRVIDD